MNIKKIISLTVLAGILFSIGLGTVNTEAKFFPWAEQNESILSITEATEEEGQLNDTYGSLGAIADDTLPLEEMLVYALQDEFTAKAEYQLIMDTYNIYRPFSNIMESEDTHINLLIPLFEKYNIVIPDNVADEHVIVPASLYEAYATGVQAEINNIAMYEKFLEQDLPDDVAIAFYQLKEASKSHLQAFERGLSRY